MTERGDPGAVADATEADQDAVQQQLDLSAKTEAMAPMLNGAAGDSQPDDVVAREIALLAACMVTRICAEYRIQATLAPLRPCGDVLETITHRDDFLDFLHGHQRPL